MGIYLCPACVWPVDQEGIVSSDGSRCFTCERCHKRIPERDLVLDLGPEQNPRIWEAVKKTLHIVKTQLKQYSPDRENPHFDTEFEGKTRYCDQELIPLLRGLYNAGYRRGKEGLQSD